MTIHSHDSIGNQLWSMAERLYPICRSMTGDGVRDTLRVLGETAPVEIHEIPTGTEVFDWTVPSEWNIRDAFVKNARGERVIDFRRCNLHVVNGSLPVSREMTWEALKPHLHTLPDQPDQVPYRTCFFREDWGFCLSQRDFDAIAAGVDGSFDVVIDATIADGSLTYGEMFLPGAVEDEILFSAHICHPSLANDNLSGLSIAAMLAGHLAGLPQRHYSYRFIFAPATIGAITWLALNRDRLHRVRHGLVLSLLGDRGCSTYKRSRSGDAVIDRVAEHVLRHSGLPFEIREFTPFGYDERQFCSPGINLPMGCLMRTPDGEFVEYHTSGDNLDFIDPQSLADSYAKCLGIVEILENDGVFVNLKPFCEPRLGQYGLYKSLPAEADIKRFQQAVQWVLNLGDGNHTLFDIAERSGLPFSAIHQAAYKLRDCGLVESQNRTDN